MQIFVHSLFSKRHFLIFNDNSRKIPWITHQWWYWKKMTVVRHSAGRHLFIFFLFIPLFLTNVFSGYISFIDNVVVHQSSVHHPFHFSATTARYTTSKWISSILNWYDFLYILSLAIVWFLFFNNHFVCLASRVCLNYLHVNFSTLTTKIL